MGCDTPEVNVGMNWGRKFAEEDAKPRITKYRPDIEDNLEKIVNAIHFYMYLHDSKGHIFDTTFTQRLEGVERNYREFLMAVAGDDKREILAEGIGVINHMWIAVCMAAGVELDKIQDWEVVLDELKERGVRF